MNFVKSGFTVLAFIGIMAALVLQFARVMDRESVGICPDTSFKEIKKLEDNGHKDIYYKDCSKNGDDND